MISAVVFVVVVACLTIQLQAAENDPVSSLPHAYSDLAVREAPSLQRRQSNITALTFANLRCTQQQIDNIFDGYPSDCNNALQTNLATQGSAQAAFSTLCLPRCNQALAQFYTECGTDEIIEVFFHICAINSDNNRCYDIFDTLFSDSSRVDASCPSNRSFCPSTCRNSILTFRENSECCVNTYNNSATFPGLPNFSFTADEYSLWASCSVETPGFCTQSTVSRPGSSGTTSSPLTALTFANLRCTQQQIDNIFDGYPSDCNNALQTNLAIPGSVPAAFSTLCLPRCSQALAQFYTECGTEEIIEVFFHVCAINSDNNRCYDIFDTLFSDSSRVDASCPSNRSSCPSTCRNSIRTFRENSECCVNTYNNSATFPGLPNFSFTADEYSLWASCSVETPGFCTQSTVSRPGSSGTTSSPCPTSSPSHSGTSSTQNPLSKMFAGIVLLGVMTMLTP